MARLAPTTIDHQLPDLQDQHTSRITVRQLLALHDQHCSTGGLDDYLCDGYMLSQNRVLRNARAHVVSRGFRLSSSELSECHGWKLMTLSYILEKKVIPYHDTVTLLREIERRNPGHFTVRDLVRVSRPGRSGILHESAHAMADALMREEKEKRGIAEATTDRDRLFEILLGESLVAACEGFAAYYGRGRMQTFLLWGYHSQVWLLPEVRAALKETIRSFGPQLAFEIWTLGFLHYNFLYDRIDATDIHQSLRVLGIAQRPSAREMRNLRVLFDDALRLNPIARTHVTFNYQYFMRLAEVRTVHDYMKAIDFEFVDTHLPLHHYRQTIAAVAAAVLSPRTTTRAQPTPSLPPDAHGPMHGAPVNQSPPCQPSDTAR